MATKIEYSVNDDTTVTPFDNNFETECDARRAGRFFLKSNPDVVYVIIFRLTILHDQVIGSEMVSTIEREELERHTVILGTFDNAQAHQEGWRLAVVDNQYRIERLDDPSTIEGLDYTDPKFNSDESAMLHVIDRAGSGSIYHIKAEEMVGNYATRPVAETVFKVSDMESGAAANLFFTELMGAVETLTGVAEHYGIRTLADLMYLQNAILDKSYVDMYEDESSVMEVVSALPNGEHWKTFVRPA